MQLGLPLFVLAVVALCYLPFLSAGTGVLGFLPHYAHEQGLDTGQGVFALAVLDRIGLFAPVMTVCYAALAGVGLLGLALWTRRGGATDPASAVRGTALLLVAALLLLSPVFPWYFVAALPMTCLLGVSSPFVLATGGFLLYAFHADAPAFFTRWGVMMGLASLAALFDLWRLRRRETSR